MSNTGISLPQNFRDRWFSTSFASAVQDRIRSESSDLEIDFSACEWIDPLPMLGLLCEIKRWADSQPKNSEHSLTIDLGSSGSGTEQLANKARVRRFLSKHGFLQSIVEGCSATHFRYDSGFDCEQLFEANKLSDLLQAIDLSHDKDGELFYHPVPACRPRFAPVLLSPQYLGATVSKFVDEIIQSMDDALFRAQLSQFTYRDSALQRLRQVATEILTNAIEHAYDKPGDGPVCIYARLRRQGDRANKTENAVHCPRISVIQDVTAARYVELFIVDVGKGLCADAAEWVKQCNDPTTLRELESMAHRITSLTDYPLRGLLDMCFRLPISKHSRNSTSSVTMQRSNVTGLQHVNNVLSHHRDAFRLSVDGDWAADSHPRQLGRNIFEVAEPVAGTSSAGTYFHFAIDIAADRGQLGSEWLCSASEAKFGFDRLRDAFQAAGISERPIEVFDVRAMMEVSADSSQKANRAILLRSKKHIGSTTKLAIFRASRNLSKGIHDRIVTQWCEDIVRNPRRSTLVFSDLSHTQAVLLADHLSLLIVDLEGKLALGKSLAEICLLSEDLVSCVLTVRAESLVRGVSGRGEQAYIRIRFEKRSTPPVGISLLPVLGALRDSDSKLFWQRIETKDLSLLQSRVQHDVVWARDPQGRVSKVLPLYLNYPMATQDRELAKITRRALRRALAAFPELTAVAVDNLVKADLADAQRWLPPQSDAHGRQSNSKLFIISTLVSGETVKREIKRLGDPNAVLCVFTATCVPAVAFDYATYAALGWISTVGKGTASDKQWERVPETPFIQEYRPTPTEPPGGKYFLKPIARIVKTSEESNDQPTPAESYREWHRARLMRVGHWEIDRRHGLIEIDHARALQQSAESHSGFYNWLEAELMHRSAKVEHPLLVYPASRLSAIMVRHLLYKTDKFPSVASKWQAVPLNYLPDIGGGLRQIEPLTLNVLKESKARNGGSAFFLDVGFVGNRTFRQTRRQLLAIGVKTVVGIGLLNRTSYPALTEELNGKEDVVGYWRVDVPTMNDERSCPMCKSLLALNALRERVAIPQPSLVPRLVQIADDWTKTDPNLSWWEHGLEPCALTKRLDKRFGFTPPAAVREAGVPQVKAGQLQMIDSDGRAIPVLPRLSDTWTADEVEKANGWHRIFLEDSTQAAIYAIEIARTTSRMAYPWSVARELATGGKPNAEPLAPGNPDAAIEVICTYLLLCGPDLSVAIKEEGARLLLQQLTLIEKVPFTSSAPESVQRLAQLRGLAILALVNLDDDTKYLLLDEVVQSMSKVRFLSQDIRVAVMAITSVGRSVGRDPGARLTSLVKGKSEALSLERSSTNLRPTSILEWNVVLTTISQLPIGQQFESALDFFGAGAHHGDMKIILDEVDRMNVSGQVTNPQGGWSLLENTLERTLSLTCEGSDLSQSTAMPALRLAPLFKALIKANDAVWIEMQQLIRPSIPGNRQESELKARALLEKARTLFHGAFLRGSSTRPQESLIDMIEKRVFEAALQADASDQFARFEALGQVDKPANGMRYLLWGSELSEFIGALCKEAKRWAVEEPASRAPTAFFPDPSVAARLWIGFRYSRVQVPELTFWNMGQPGADEDAFLAGAQDLIKVYCALGGDFRRQIVDEGENGRWFVSNISLVSISGGKR